MKRFAVLQLLLQFAPLSALVASGPVVDLVLLSSELQLIKLLLLFDLLSELHPHAFYFVYFGLLLHLSLLGELHDLFELCHFLAVGVWA